MKLRYYLMSSLVVLTFGATSQSLTRMEQSKQLTCKLTTPELQKRKATVIAELKALMLSKKELNNGYSYEFKGSDETLDILTSFIKTERLCCDFFTFQLTVEENKAKLNITGPEGTKEFIKEEIGF